ncbi:N-acetylmuramoyl-L-alanine amidase [Flavobacterium sp.]|uniref:N-acetylmuramoyl-L-alanine amidase n=1 Tax=Flavobacterium sp. TaxID=239 RepID=UPI00286DBB29|nr:N-acetylmuramoyl-L-alanine amidase [Flavobacterium sp.]
MKIANQRLAAEDPSEKIIQETTTNRGGIINSQFIIIHFTSGREAESSVSWFKNPDAEASAHIVIGRDGKIFQLIDFNKKAWHAGVSRWAHWNGLNNFSIGIELENPGRLTKRDGKFYSWFEKEYTSTDIVELIHKHEDQPSFWLSYTEKQLASCMEVCKQVLNKYPIIDILGHDDIAPFRKNDPGPMFPMESFRAKLLGRQNDIGDIYKTITDQVNIRKGAGTQFESMAKLQKDTELAFIKSNNGWFYVFVAEKPKTGDEVLYGWIHNSLVTK